MLHPSAMPSVGGIRVRDRHVPIGGGDFTFNKNKKLLARGCGTASIFVRITFSVHLFPPLLQLLP